MNRYESTEQALYFKAPNLHTQHDRYWKTELKIRKYDLKGTSVRLPHRIFDFINIEMGYNQKNEYQNVSRAVCEANPNDAHIPFQNEHVTKNDLAAISCKLGIECQGAVAHTVEKSSIIVVESEEV